MQRTRLITTLVFFVAGFSVLFSLDLSGTWSTLGFRPGGPFILVGGLIFAAFLYFALPKVIPKSRPCTNCHQPVLIGAVTCPACGERVMRRGPQRRAAAGTIPPRDKP